MHDSSLPCSTSFKPSKPLNASSRPNINISTRLPANINRRAYRWIITRTSDTPFPRIEQHLTYADWGQMHFARGWSLRNKRQALRASAYSQGRCRRTLGMISNGFWELLTSLITANMSRLVNKDSHHEEPNFPKTAWASFGQRIRGHAIQYSAVRDMFQWWTLSRQSGDKPACVQTIVMRRPR